MIVGTSQLLPWGHRETEEQVSITSAMFELNHPFSTPASGMRPQPALRQPLGGQEGQEVAWKQQREHKSSLSPSWLPTWGLLRW